MVDTSIHFEGRGNLAKVGTEYKTADSGSPQTRGRVVIAVRRNSADSGNLWGRRRFVRRLAELVVTAGLPLELNGLVREHGG